MSPRPPLASLLAFALLACGGAAPDAPGPPAPSAAADQAPDEDDDEDDDAPASVTPAPTAVRARVRLPAGVDADSVIAIWTARLDGWAPVFLHDGDAVEVTVSPAGELDWDGLGAILTLRGELSVRPLHGDLPALRFLAARTELTSPSPDPDALRERVERVARAFPRQTRLPTGVSLAFVTIDGGAACVAVGPPVPAPFVPGTTRAIGDDEARAVVATLTPAARTALRAPEALVDRDGTVDRSSVTAGDPDLVIATLWAPAATVASRVYGVAALLPAGLVIE
jgi:hypothetical protein